MSWHKSAVIAFVFLFTSCSQTMQSLSKSDTQKEDEKILHALMYKNQNDLNASAAIFRTLFEQTNKQEYAKEVLLNLMAQKDKEGADRWLQTHTSLMGLFDNATRAKIYEFLQKYELAIMHYEDEYAKTKDPLFVIAQAQIYQKLQNPSKAIALLGHYIDTEGCQIQLCMKMLQYLEAGQDDKKVLALLVKLHRMYKNSHDMMRSQTVFGAINALIHTLPTQEAILFLELHRGLNDQLLLNFYKQNNQPDKVSALLVDIFNASNDYTYLAQSAIYEYESANEKALVLQSVRAKFEKALAQITNHEFQNFYGYLLIDHDLDYTKGIEFVKKALVQDKDNLAYLDSLAWGYYKIGSCKDAKKIMQRVVHETGLGDAEIKMHWDKISACKESK